MQKGIFLQDLNIKSGTVNNAIIQLGDIDDSGKGRKFVSKFIQPGLVKIEGHGIVLLRKETLDESLPTIVGSPVIIQHKDVTEENADELRCGVIANAYFNQPDGWYYVDGIIWDDKAQDLINKGWSVSCSYDYLAFNDEGGEENNIHYDKEFTQLNFTHLAIVDNPRYERANIVFNSKDEEKGKWVTIKGTHIFIPDGKTLDEVIKEKGWGDKENKQSDSENKHGFKKDKDSGYYMKDLSDGTSVYVEKKKGGQGEKEPFYLEATHFDKDGKEIAKKQYHYDSMDGMFGKIDKDFVSKDKQSDTKDKQSEGKDEGKGYSLSDKYKNPKHTMKVISLLKEAGISQIKKGFEAHENDDRVFITIPQNVLIEHENNLRKIFKKSKDIEDVYFGTPIRGLQNITIKFKKVKTNNSKEQDMAIIDELKKLIFKVENNKENEMGIDEKVENAQVDKRKLIDEVAGIMKSAGCDDEDIRTAIGKMEKIGYDDSEASADNKKVKNEADEEDKKVDNEEDEEKEEKEEEKVDNESEEDKEKAEDLKEDEKKDVENKCKNSVENAKGEEFFDKINKIYNSAKKIEEPSVEYESKQARLDAGKEYFG